MAPAPDSGPALPFPTGTADDREAPLELIVRPWERSRLIPGEPTPADANTLLDAASRLDAIRRNLCQLQESNILRGDEETRVARVVAELFDMVKSLRARYRRMADDLRKRGIAR